MPGQQKANLNAQGYLLRNYLCVAYNGSCIQSGFCWAVISSHRHCAECFRLVCPCFESRFPMPCGSRDEAFAHDARMIPRKISSWNQDFFLLGCRALSDAFCIDSMQSCWHGAHSFALSIQTSLLRSKASEYALPSSMTSLNSCHIPLTIYNIHTVCTHWFYFLQEDGYTFFLVQ